MELGTFCTNIFFKIISTTFSFFFVIRLIDSIEVKTVLLFRFFSFHSIIWSEIDKMFEDKKIQFTTPLMVANITWLQNRSPSVSQLCSTVARGAPSFISYVLDGLCNKSFGRTRVWAIFFTNMGMKLSSWILKKNITRKKNTHTHIYIYIYIYMPNNDYVVSVGLQGTNK
jgi:hypothetical protein